MPDIVLNVEIQKLSAAELKGRLDQGEAITMVDLRDKEDQAVGTIKGSRWIKLEDLMARYDEIPKDQVVCLLCLRGKQSPIAGQYLAKKGYNKVFMLDGGVEKGWVAAGYPVEKAK